MSGKDNGEDFALPDIDFLFTHEVEDKEHPVYTEYSSEEYNNTEYEDEENDVGTEMDVKKSTTKRSKAVKRESGSVNRQETKERSEGRTAPENRVSREGSRPVRRKKRKKRPVSSENNSVRNANSESVENSAGKEGSGRKTYVDKKTGLEYELLPGSDKEAVKAYKSTKGKGLGINEMFKYTDLAEDFDGFDLVSDAKKFLPHMRVPISEEERQAALKKLKESKKRERMQRMQEEDFDDFED